MQMRKCNCPTAWTRLGLESSAVDVSAIYLAQVIPVQEPLSPLQYAWALESGWSASGRQSEVAVGTLTARPVRKRVTQQQQQSHNYCAATITRRALRT